MKIKILMMLTFILMPLVCHGMHFERRRYRGDLYLLPVYTPVNKTQFCDNSHSEAQSSPTFLQKLLAFLCATEIKREQQEFIQPQLKPNQLRRRATCSQLPRVDEW